MKVRKQNCYLDRNMKKPPKCKSAPVFSTTSPPLSLLSISWSFNNRLVHSMGSYLTPGLQEVSNLGHGHKVSHMWFPRGGCAPVNFKFPLLQDLLQLLFPKNLLWRKQKSRFSAGPPPCSSFILQTKSCVTGGSGSEPMDKCH